MKYDIFYDQKLCSGCLRCQLACSQAFAECFRPSVARIRVEAIGEKYRVSFADDCQACGVCADNCLFRALSKILKEVAR